MKASRGFTLIELAITVAIVGFLSAAAYPLAELSIQRHKESELRTALREIRSAIDAYHAAALVGKIERRADETGYPKRLDDLVQGIDDINDPKRKKVYFLRRLPRDPFSDDKSADPAETWGKRSYASPPDLPLEGDDVFDVYSRSERVGMNGIAYRDW